MGVSEKEEGLAAAAAEGAALVLVLGSEACSRCVESGLAVVEAPSRSVVSPAIYLLCSALGRTCALAFFYSIYS